MSNQKEGFKEVWHVWGGDFENAPRDFTSVKQRDGEIIRGSDLKYISDYDFMHLEPDSEDSLTDIIAYTTGQMRRRVDCARCNGNRIVFERKGKDSDFIGDCPSCSGKGYQWECK